MSDLQKSTPFNFFIPASFEKSKDEATGKTKLRIKGIASTIDKDSDEEILEPSGFQLSRLLKYGYFNYNHNAKTDPSAIVGEPDVAKIVNNKLYVEGDLYSDSPLAQKIFATAEMLEKSGSKRQFGFSIEGKSLEKDPLNDKRITKAMITGIAITPTPKNSNTLLSIVKGEYQEDYIEPECEEDESGNILDVTSTDGRQVTIDKDFNITLDRDKKLKKSLSTATGSAVVRQDLEQNLKMLQKSEVDSLQVLVNSNLLEKSIEALFEKGIVLVKQSSIETSSNILLKAFFTEDLSAEDFEKSMKNLSILHSSKSELEYNDDVYYGYHLIY